MILTVLSFLLIASYTVGVCVSTHGIPNSISESYYKIKHKFWFAVATIGTASMLMPSILERTPESFQFLAFLMCAGLCFVGVAPNFKAGLDRPVHIVATTIAALCSQIWVALTCPWLLLVWLAWLLYIGVRIKQVWNGDWWYSLVLCKPLFWAEIICFSMVYFELIIM